MALGVKVKYFDPAGNPRDGYIIDNKTYKDPEGNVRVELGSVVETADGSYTLTKNGGVKTDVLRRNYENAGKSILSSKDNAEMAIRSNYAGRKNKIENYKKEARKNYEKAVVKENTKKTLNEKNMAQKLKAQGINGGMSESALIANNILYEENINELGEKLNKTLSDYDNLLADLAYEMSSEIMKSNAEYDSMYADFLMESGIAINNDINAEKNLNAENFRFNQEYNREIFEDERDFERGVFESDREYMLEDEKNKRAIYEDERDFMFKYDTDKRDYERSVYEDDRDYKRGVIESDRNYSKSTSSKNNSSSDDKEEYSRALKNAQELAKFGDYSAMAELFGWTKEQQEKAENEYYLK